MKKIKLVPGATNILLSHGSCYDTNLNVILHCPQEPREIILPESLINMPWDFTFLGHIHERGFIGSKDGGVSDTSGRKQFYGGSILRRGFTDKYCKLGRGWTLWTINDNKSFTPIFYKLWQRPQFDLPAIDTTEMTSTEVETKLLSQLTKLCKELGPITDDNAPIVRQTVHNIVPAKYVAINWKRIMKYAKQFLSYNLRKDLKENTDNNADDDEMKQDATAIGKQQDIVAAFDKWSSDEDNIKNVENKKEVITNTKDYLRKGQESVLENDN